MSKALVFDLLMRTLTDTLDVDEAELSSIVRGKATLDCPTLERLARRLFQLHRPLDQINSILIAAGCHPLESSQRMPSNSTSANPQAFREQVLMMLDQAGITATEFAKKLNYSREYTSRMLHGKAKLDQKAAGRMIEVLAGGGMIQTQEQGNELLGLMAMSPFSDEWWDVLGVKALDPERKVKNARLKADLAHHTDLSDVPIDRYPASFLASFIRDRLQPPHLRIRVLDWYVALGHDVRELLDELSDDFDESVRQQVVTSIIKGAETRKVTQGMQLSPQIVSRSTLERLLCDQSKTIAKAAVGAARVLVELGDMPIDVLALPCTTAHSFWEVRRDAINALVHLDRAESVDLLCRFHTTKYHVSRKTIARYFIRRHEERRLTESQRDAALDILHHFKQNTEAAPEDSSTLRFIIGAIEDIK